MKKRYCCEFSLNVIEIHVFRCQDNVILCLFIVVLNTSDWVFFGFFWYIYWYTCTIFSVEPKPRISLLNFWCECIHIHTCTCLSQEFSFNIRKYILQVWNQWDLVHELNKSKFFRRLWTPLRRFQWGLCDPIDWNGFVDILLTVSNITIKGTHKNHIKIIYKKWFKYCWKMLQKKFSPQKHLLLQYSSILKLH